MTYVFTNDYKTDLHRHIDDLYTRAKTLDTTREERLQASDDLIEAYYAHCEKIPDNAPLERLASLILREELTDDNPYKVSHEAEPILNERQEERRYKRERRAGVVEYGNKPTTGFRKGVYTDNDGTPQFTRTRLY